MKFKTFLELDGYFSNDAFDGGDGEPGPDGHPQMPMLSLIAGNYNKDIIVKSVSKDSDNNIKIKTSDGISLVLPIERTKKKGLPESGDRLTVIYSRDNDIIDYQINHSFN